jgi:hypothetical protein
MTQTNLRKVAIATSTFACVVLLSFGWSAQRGISLSIESAQAQTGRPLTPRALPALRIDTTGGLRTVTVPARRPDLGITMVVVLAITNALSGGTIVARVGTGTGCVVQGLTTEAALGKRLWIVKNHVAERLLDIQAALLAVL